MAFGMTANAKPLCILLVEDDALIGELLAEMLADMGHRVCPVESTEAGAVAAAANCQPDLLIVDAGLRQGSGLNAVSDILRERFIPHVFMSGNLASVRARRPDAIMLQKPFEELYLRRAIERAMASVPTTAKLH